jgi:hypothetical protein
MRSPRRVNSDHSNAAQTDAEAVAAKMPLQVRFLHANAESEFKTHWQRRIYCSP